MNRGDIYTFDRERPSRGDDDERTPYRVIVTPGYLLSAGENWVTVAPIERFDPDRLVAVPLADADPVQGWIRPDRVMTVYRPWLSGPVGRLSDETIAVFDERLKAAQGLD
ncbi:type II toxin-antitoxin system PemK/MazF family toxin [Nocardia farcinica]|uniref:type II toxin-antitoxin system PemK/MazF family toxin n=1 Tax=Nocardia farcinica TaxID=37329 RepID=UPI0018942134|nr:type II toxin-antitoxin system PemK/MazF family toxin [Nocardia farcinica]MBF6072886.1 type II toxin-antitoxin system PemK/MazF family toxin [Nocardia farcinica]MCZ9330293.1 type II toxin-antitoxin system PemK/MazF family toxin [Nocardia farcinica]